MATNYRTMLLASVTILFACEGVTPPLKAGPPAAMLVVSGDAQSGVVNTELAQPLVARVLDANGTPVPGHAISFVVTAGDGNVFAGVSVSNDSGIVQEYWTLGTSTATEQTVEARAVDPTSGEKLTFAVFHATATAGAPATIEHVHGQGQSATTSTPVPDSLAVLVRDQYGNPRPDVTVNWIVTGGSASPASSTTNAEGIARSQWTLDPSPGSQSLLATAGALAGVEFAATGLIGRYVVTPGASSVIAGEQVTVSAQFSSWESNPLAVSGRVVTWSSSNGGSFSAPTSTTNASGVATVTFTAGTAAGTSHVLSATDANQQTGSSTPVTTEADAAVKLAFGFPPQAVGQNLPFFSPVQVVVQDQHGNVVPGATHSVTVSLASNPGGATLSGTRTVNAVNGVATFATLSFDQVGTGYTIAAASGSLTGTASAPFSVKAVPNVTATTLATGTEIRALTVQDGFVYFIDDHRPPGSVNGAGVIEKVPVTGGTPVQVTALEEFDGPAARIGADPSRLFWLEYDRVDDQSWLVLMPIGGGAKVVRSLGSSSSGSTINYLADDDQFIYAWGQVFFPAKASPTRGPLQQISKASGFTVDRSPSCMNQNCPVGAFTVHDGRYYYLGSGSVNVLPPGADAPTPLTTGPLGFGTETFASNGGEYRTTDQIIVAGDWVYFLLADSADATNTELKRVPVAGGAVTTVVTGLKRSAHSLATDGNAIYLNDDGTVRKFDIADWYMTVVASADSVMYLTLDGGFVYWTSSGSPYAVKRAPKP